MSAAVLQVVTCECGAFGEGEEPVIHNEGCVERETSGELALPKICGKCKKWKPRSAFHRRSQSADGLMPACRRCRAAYYLERRRLNNPRRAVRALLLKGNSYVRCTLPRAGEAQEAALAHRDICGALCFSRGAIAHVRDVHGVDATIEQLRDVFVAVAESTEDDYRDYGEGGETP